MKSMIVRNPPNVIKFSFNFLRIVYHFMVSEFLFVFLSYAYGNTILTFCVNMKIKCFQIVDGSGPNGSFLLCLSTYELELVRQLLGVKRVDLCNKSTLVSENKLYVSILDTFKPDVVVTQKDFTLKAFIKVVEMVCVKDLRRYLRTKLTESSDTFVLFFIRQFPLIINV